MGLASRGAVLQSQGVTRETAVFRRATRTPQRPMHTGRWQAQDSLAIAQGPRRVLFPPPVAPERACCRSANDAQAQPDQSH